MNVQAVYGTKKFSYSARKYDIADMGSKWDKRWLVKFKFLHGFFFGNYFTLFFFN